MNIHEGKGYLDLDQMKQLLMEKESRGNKQ